MDAVLEPIHEAAPAEQRLRMSYEEYSEWAGEGTRAEWVNGEVIVLMPAKPRHADLIGFLVALLRNYTSFFNLARVMLASIEMKTSPTSNAREPDILVIANENLHRVAESKVEGPADLVVEVVSDESVKRDYETKYAEYEAAGVREYWILDPRPGNERAEFYQLDEQERYRRVLAANGIYRSVVLRGFWLDEAWLWPEEKPDPLLTAAEILDLPPFVIEALQARAERGPDAN